jgi:hypothetical protein
VERLADAGFRGRGANWVGRGRVCAKPMIGSRSDDLLPTNKKKKDKSVAGPIGEGESSGTGEFCTLVEKARKDDKTCQVGIKTLRLRLYGMRRAQGHGPTEPVAGRGRRSIMSGA